MEPILKVRGAAIPFDRPNVDTDQIIPGRFIMKPRDYDYASLLFHDLRHGAGAEAGFPLDLPAYRGAPIMLTGANFGCGSAREQAVWAIQESGIRVLIGPSFGGIFYANCMKNGLLPAIVPEATVAALSRSSENILDIDLEKRTIQDTTGRTFAFEIGDSERAQLMSGKDDITRTLEHEAEIDAFERAYRAGATWDRPLAGPAIAATRRIPIRSSKK